MQDRLLGTRQARVGDVANQDVTGPELVLEAFHEQATLDEAVARGPHRRGREPRQRGHPSHLERAAEDGARLHHSPPWLVKTIETCLDSRLNRVRKELLRRRVLDHGASDLECEEWISVCP